MSPAQCSPWFRRAAVLAVALLPLACAPGDEGGREGEGPSARRAGEGRRAGAGGRAGARAELVAAVAERTGQSQEQAAASIDALFDEVGERLAAGEEVRVRDFGTFSVVRRRARRGEAPGTGAEVAVPERAAVRFRPAKSLREAVADAPVEAAPRPAAEAAPADEEAGEEG